VVLFREGVLWIAKDTKRREEREHETAIRKKSDE
jgi:hypothetical protein